MLISTCLRPYPFLSSGIVITAVKGWVTFTPQCTQSSHFTTRTSLMTIWSLPDDVIYGDTSARIMHPTSAPILLLIPDIYEPELPRLDSNFESHPNCHIIDMACVCRLSHVWHPLLAVALLIFFSASTAPSEFGVRILGDAMCCFLVQGQRPSPLFSEEFYRNCEVFAVISDVYRTV